MVWNGQGVSSGSEYLRLIRWEWKLFFDFSFVWGVTQSFELLFMNMRGFLSFQSMRLWIQDQLSLLTHKRSACTVQLGAQKHLPFLKWGVLRSLILPISINKVLVNWCHAVYTSGCRLMANFSIKMSNAFGLNCWTCFSLWSVSENDTFSSIALSFCRYRARIERVESPAKVHVFYIDYGNVSIGFAGRLIRNLDVAQHLLSGERRCWLMNVLNCLKYCICFQKPALNPSFKMPHVWKTIPLHTFTAALAKMQNKCGFARKWC